MNDLETHLRRTLEHASEKAPHPPTGLSGQIVVRSRRRRTRAQAAIATGVVAAIAVPLTWTLAGGSDHGATVSPVERKSTGQNLEDRPPLGERLVIENPSEHRPLKLWFTKAANGATYVCESMQSREGSGTSSCGGDSAERLASLQGSTESWPPPEKVLYYGTLDDAVAAVSAVAKDGARTAGQIRRPEGAPRAIWTVTAPATAKVTSFEFSDAQGKVLTSVRNEALVVPEATAKPVGRAEKLPDGLTANIYEVPDRTLIWTLKHQRIATHLVREQDLMTDLGGNKYFVELRERDKRWFGIASAETAKVELVFADGRTATTNARPDIWHLGITLFAGTHQQTGDIYREGFKIIGYDGKGREIWREPHPAQKP